MNQINGIVARNQLSKDELDQIKALEQACTTADPMMIKLNWNTLGSRTGTEVNDFLMYKDGKLVGFLGLYSFGSVEIETSGMIHPDYRRSGLFTELLTCALIESKNRQYKKMLLIAPGSSNSGKAFVVEANSEYSFSEYYMERNDSSAPVTAEGTRVSLRQATEADASLLVQLNQDGFSMTYEDAEEWVKHSLSSDDDINLIAELDGVPIGKLGIMVQEKNAFIFGFCVATEYQGQGHGRNILNQAIIYGQNVLHKPYSALEVSVSNEGALNLYLSCGFMKVSSNDYYSIIL